MSVMKKNRKFGLWIGALVGTMLLVTACGVNSSGDTQTNVSSANDVKTIYIYQNKIEIDEALQKTTADYTALHPDVHFKIESVSDNYATGLKAKLASGEMPDLFTVVGNQNLKMWQSHLENLADQKWTADMIDIAKPAITGSDGGIYGMPVSIEGYGYVYNKKLFHKAGIAGVPLTFTDFQTDVEKLKSAKVQPVIQAYSDWYQAGNFMVNMGIARQPNPNAFIKGLYDGSATFVGNDIFRQVAEFIQYDFKQGKNDLSTSFNAQTAALYNGEVAMTVGGNWLQPTVNTISGLDVGLMPIPVNDKAGENDKLYVGVTGYWSVSKDSKVKEEVKDFLKWLVTTPEGQAHMVKDMRTIPAFHSFAANDVSRGALNAEMSRYLQAGKVYGNFASYYPDGVAQAFGEDVQKLVAGKINTDGFLQALQDDWDRLAH